MSRRYADIIGVTKKQQEDTRTGEEIASDIIGKIARKE